MRFRNLAVFVLISGMVSSCDTIRTLYTSSKSSKDYWTINAHTIIHCCTHLYTEVYKNGKHVSQIVYLNEGATKRIFNYDHYGHLTDTVVLKATLNGATIPFDSLDYQVYQQIRKLIEKREGLDPELRWTEYKGYSAVGR